MSTVIRGKRFQWRPVAALLLLATFACSRTPEDAAPSTQAAITPSPPAQAVTPVSSRIAFQCLWWSPEQMEGFDPNNPPPQLTPTPLSKWEYSDPVGVPHPDLVDALIEIESSGPAASIRASAVLSEQWLIGVRDAKEQAQWQPWQLVGDPQAITLSSEQAQTIKHSVNVAGKMSELVAQNQWPWAYRLQVQILDAQPPSEAGPSSPIASAIAELPIEGGD